MVTTITVVSDEHLGYIYSSTTTSHDFLLSHMKMQHVITMCCTDNLSAASVQSQKISEDLTLPDKNKNNPPSIEKIQ